MIGQKQHHRQLQYRPQTGKTLRQVLIGFISREFPRLGGPWVVKLFVDKLLELIDKYHISSDLLTPGQTLWPAIALDEVPGYRKPTHAMRQVPVVITVVNQDDIDNLRENMKWTEVLKRAVVRAANDAYAQGGVLTTTDLSVLFHRGHSRIAELIREYEATTGEIVPRRGNVHDIGRTISHKRIICRKAFLEGKTTPKIAQETHHSPLAVDHYLLDFARVHFATIQRSMTPEETVFAIQRPLYLVEEYVKMIAEFGLNEDQIYNRTGIQMAMRQERIEPSIDNTQSETKDPQEESTLN